MKWSEKLRLDCFRFEYLFDIWYLLMTIFRLIILQFHHQNWHFNHTQQISTSIILYFTQFIFPPGNCPNTTETDFSIFMCQFETFINYILEYKCSHTLTSTFHSIMPQDNDLFWLLIIDTVQETMNSVSLILSFSFSDTLLKNEFVIVKTMVTKERI